MVEATLQKELAGYRKDQSVNNSSEDGAVVGKTECGFAAVALLSTWHLDKSGFGRWFDHQLLHQPSKH